MGPEECRRRFTTADHGYLATAGLDGRPHLVPIAFAVAGDVIVTAVDTKPKSSRGLRRLRNLQENPRAALLVDGYDADWTRLWWVRADATCRVVEASAAPWAIAALQEKYPHYREQPPPGPVILAAVDRWSGWRSFD